MSIEYSSHLRSAPDRLVYLERTGTSLHLWLGPFGVHLWRHPSKHQRVRIAFDFVRDWR